MARSKHAAQALLVLLALAWPQGTRAQGQTPDGPRVGPTQLVVAVERVELPNGLVVLLAPDETTSSVLVWMTFRAGALYEPAGRSGLAHLVEHILATGPTPQTDYASLLESRRARYFNAVTSPDALAFQTTVPAEELPLALWVAADRLGTLPSLIDAALVDRHRRVVEQERAALHLDQPFGLVNEQVMDRLFAPPHPLYGGVIGAPTELSQATAEEVRAFVADLLVPANAVLTLAGRFDPVVAKRLVAERLGPLPAGRRAPDPKIPSFAGLSGKEKRVERIARQPRVTMAWRFANLPRDHARVLQLGALLLTLLTDGAWGMRLGAGLLEYPGEAVFRLDVQVPYDESVEAVQADADGFLRMLTLRQVSDDLMLAANLALDRAALFGLATLKGRATLLTQLELAGEDVKGAAAYLLHHWNLPVDLVRDVARGYLKRPRVTVHARPSRPRPAKAPREDEE